MVYPSMSEKTSTRRYIVCVDGVTDAASGVSCASSIKNASTISRLKSVIQEGLTQDDKGGLVKQTVIYHSVVVPSSNLAGRFTKALSPSEQQIRDISFEIFQKLEDPSDEIWLFGSGLGAFVARAVAGTMHHMGIPQPGRLAEFSELYKTTLTLMKARQTDDSQKGGEALTFLRARTQGTPNIQFVGLFDAIRSGADEGTIDTSIVGSIRHFRHAMAFNETRGAHVLDLPPTPNLKDMSGRSVVQAWFLGQHVDLIGGTQHDGLSLYSLQWILIEVLLCGLAVSFDITTKEMIPTENPLALTFPQYAGQLPNLSGDEKILWQIRFVNNMLVNMFDINSVHVPSDNAGLPSHTIHFDNAGGVHNSRRKIFDKEGLIGFSKQQDFGTIIHPSVFCILDRNQKFFEQSRFKPYKENLADFEMNCMRGNAAELPPWLENSQLLASGVKAFRILVCGKTGVGKSTLINKVFGVEMTEESTSYTQGNHDINTAFESTNHPGLLIHDSRGWQAGSDRELDLIAQFLRHRAFQKDPAEALHVIWFCVDSDVSRIEEAEKRTFETIAQYSNNVPVFVIGTKKDKLVAFRKMQLLEQYMDETNDYKESSRLANLEADQKADEQFDLLREQLGHIKSYKADGYICLSKNDEIGIRRLLTQTLDLIADERVRLFCVAAQVVDVDQKINSAISEVMRLSTHAIRTAMVPLPFSGTIATPTVSRLICEHVLLCFGFPKAMPEEVEAIMSKIVLGELRRFMTVTMTHFMLITTAATGVAIGTAGIGAVLGLGACIVATPPTARMLLKCATDMILILERSFRYSGKYVSIKQIEDAAKQYVTISTTTFGGKEKRLQDHIRKEIDLLVPLTKVSIGWRFKRLRTGFEQIIYNNRFDRPPEYEEGDAINKVTDVDGSSSAVAELPVEGSTRAEMPGTTYVAELEDTGSEPVPGIPELPGSGAPTTILPTRSAPQSTSQPSELGTVSSPTTSRVSSTPPTELSATPSVREGKLERNKSDGTSIFSRGWKSMKKKSKTTS